MTIYNNLPDVARLAINRMVAVTEKEKKLLHTAVDSAVDTALAYADATVAASGHISNVVEDTTPQLGGSLDVNSNKIVSTANGNIDIEPNGTGNVLLGNFIFNADQTVGAGQDDYVLTYDNGTGLINLEVAASGGGSLSNIVEDVTPQLGGSLDVNGQSIVSAAAGNIAITPDTTGDVILDGLKWPQADGTAGYVLKTNGAAQLSWVVQPTTGIANVVEDVTPQLGASLDVNGFSLVSAAAGNIAITPDTTGDIILDGLKWPQADGSADQVLKTDGAAQLSWVANAGSGIANVVDDLTPQLGGALDVNGNSIVSAAAGSIAITPDTTGDVIIDGLKWPQADGTSGQILKTDGAAQLSWVANAAGMANVVEDVTPQLGADLDGNNFNILLTNTGTAKEVRFYEPSGGGASYAGIKAPSLAATYTLTLPTTDGTASQVLETDGSGVLSWGTPSGGATTFLGLTDTPSTYAAQALLWTRVNAGATALEFVAAPVSSVSGTGAIGSTGGATPVISIVAASGSVPGSMSTADFSKLGGIETSADKTDATNVDAAMTASGTGLVARTGAGTWAKRTVTAGNEITVTNGNGVSDNPTVALTRVITSGTGAATAGANGDIHFRYV